MSIHGIGTVSFSLTRKAASRRVRATARPPLTEFDAARPVIEAGVVGVLRQVTILRLLSCEIVFPGATNGVVQIYFSISLILHRTDVVIYDSARLTVPAVISQIRVAAGKC